MSRYWKVYRIHRYNSPNRIWVKVRIKKWFIEAHSTYSEDGKEGRNEDSWWFADRETDKAYHLWSKQKHLWEGCWVPKSCVIEEKEA